MITILTGLSGSGKTAILGEAKIENAYHADEYVKDVFYKKDAQLYQLIKREFGDGVVNDKEVDTHALGKIVFNEPEQLNKLNKLVAPFVREWFKSIDGDAIIEMAAYINYVDTYKDLVDKVIMVIKDKPNLEEKFTYMDSKKQPIFNTDISPDYILENNGTIKEGAEKLVSLYSSITK